MARETSGWQKKFAAPIDAGGKSLRTLRDAGHYVTKLPKATAELPHWQNATKYLIEAAKHPFFVMVAEIAMRTALNHGKPPPDPEPRRKSTKKYRVIR
jgi:hypothetical protein